MSEQDNTTMNTANLDGLIKALEARRYTIKIGILGANASRSPQEDESSTTPEKPTKKKPGKNDLNKKIALSKKNSRDKKKDLNNTNIRIGLTHEFGSKYVPLRSFLRMPLTEKYPQELQKAGLIEEDTLKEIIKSENFRGWAKMCAVVGVATVLQAFDTGGFGKWAPLSPRTLAKKKVQQILVETQQLRDSITYEIKS